MFKPISLTAVSAAFLSLTLMGDASATLKRSAPEDLHRHPTAQRPCYENKDSSSGSETETEGERRLYYQSHSQETSGEEGDLERPEDSLSLETVLGKSAEEEEPMAVDSRSLLENLAWNVLELFPSITQNMTFNDALSLSATSTVMREVTLKTLIDTNRVSHLNDTWVEGCEPGSTDNFRANLYSREAMKTLLQLRRLVSVKESPMAMQDTLDNLEKKSTLTVKIQSITSSLEALKNPKMSSIAKSITQAKDYLLSKRKGISVNPIVLRQYHEEVQKNPEERYLPYGNELDFCFFLTEGILGGKFADMLIANGTDQSRITNSHKAELKNIISNIKQNHDMGMWSRHKHISQNKIISKVSWDTFHKYSLNSLLDHYDFKAPGHFCALYDFFSPIEPMQFFINFTKNLPLSAIERSDFSEEDRQKAHRALTFLKKLANICPYDLSHLGVQYYQQLTVANYILRQYQGASKAIHKLADLHHSHPNFKQEVYIHCLQVDYTAGNMDLILQNLNQNHKVLVRPKQNDITLRESRNNALLLGLYAAIVTENDPDLIIEMYEKAFKRKRTHVLSADETVRISFLPHFPPYQGRYFFERVKEANETVQNKWVAKKLKAQLG